MSLIPIDGAVVSIFVHDEALQFLRAWAARASEWGDASVGPTAILRIVFEEKGEMAQIRHLCNFLSLFPQWGKDGAPCKSLAVLFSLLVGKIAAKVDGSGFFEIVKSEHLQWISAIQYVLDFMEMQKKDTPSRGSLLQMQKDLRR
jgi:hypothetical protein